MCNPIYRLSAFIWTTWRYLIHACLSVPYGTPAAWTIRVQKDVTGFAGRRHVSYRFWARRRGYIITRGYYPSRLDALNEALQAIDRDNENGGDAGERRPAYIDPVDETRRRRRYGVQYLRRRLARRIVALRRRYGYRRTWALTVSYRSCDGVRYMELSPQREALRPAEAHWRARRSYHVDMYRAWTRRPGPAHWHPDYLWGLQDGAPGAPS